MTDTERETFTPYNITPRAESSRECDYCDEGAEYGPHHHELYESREGASLHTADELADIFLDAVEAYASPWRRAWHVPRDVEGWAEGDTDPTDPGYTGSEALSDEIAVAEGVLGDAGYYVSWNDGYVIERVIEEPTTEYLDTAARAYGECADWADAPRDEAGEAIDYTLSDGDEARMCESLRAFVVDNWADLENMEPTQAGEDFWLTRNHHGAGFWDRGLGEVGERLTQAAHAYGEDNLENYVTYTRGECEVLVEVDGVASGEYLRDCACGRPIFQSRMAGTIYHASEDR